MVLKEMRTFLDSVRKITEGIAEKNNQKVISAARSVGNSAQGGMPGSLVAKLPIGFKKLGFDTHARFDRLAMDVASMDDSDVALTQLAELTKNCVACHEIYRISIPENK